MDLNVLSKAKPGCKIQPAHFTSASPPILPVESRRERSFAKTPPELNYFVEDVASFGATEATIFAKRGSSRRGSQNGNSFNPP